MCDKDAKISAITPVLLSSCFGQPHQLTSEDCGNYHFACGKIFHDLEKVLRISGGAVVKNLPADARDANSIHGLGRSPEQEMATHSSTPAWKIPWTGETGGLQSIGSQRAGHDWATEHTHAESQHGVWTTGDIKKYVAYCFISEYFLFLKGRW